MRQPKRQLGFTLIEVSLAIVIGVTLLAGAIVLYQQTSKSVKNTKAKEKLMALTVVIEELDARTYRLPTLADLNIAWQQKRPDDYNTSPWGGTYPNANTTPIGGNDAVGPGQEIGQGSGGTPFAGATNQDVGKPFYFKRDPNVAGRPYIWLDEIGNFGPADPQSVVRTFGYAVAYIGPDGQQWHFVEGRQRTNTAGGPTAVDGQIVN